MIRAIVACALMLPFGVYAAGARPFKESLSPNNFKWIGEAAFYARADTEGLGFEYVDNTKGTLFAGTLASIVNRSLVPLAASAVVDTALSVKPLSRLQHAANEMAPVLRPAQAQQLLELTFKQALIDSGRFNDVGTIRPFHGGDKNKETTAASFDENVALTVSMSYRLTPEVNRLHVVLVAEIFDKAVQREAQQARKPFVGYKLGRIYRNRFGYFSEPLPLLPPKNAAEIAAKVAEVEAKYAAPLNAEDQRRMDAELKQVREPWTNEQQWDHVLSEWAANEGQRLKDEIVAGIMEGVRLLMMDVADTAMLANPQKGRLGEFVEDRGQRQVYRRLGEDAGVMLSWPRGYFNLHEPAVLYADD